MAHKTFRGTRQQVRFGGSAARSNACLSTRVTHPAETSLLPLQTTYQLGPQSLVLDALKFCHTAPKARNPQSACFLPGSLTRSLSLFFNKWSFSFFLNIYLFLTLLGLCCCSGFLLVSERRGYLRAVVLRLLTAVVSLVQSTCSRHLSFSSCGTRA